MGTQKKHLDENQIDELNEKTGALEQRIKEIATLAVKDQLDKFREDTLEVPGSPLDALLIQDETQRQDLFGKTYWFTIITIAILYIALLAWLYCSINSDWHIFTIGVVALGLPASTLSLVLIKSLSKIKSKDSDVAISLGLKAILDTIKEVASMFKAK